MTESPTAHPEDFSGETRATQAFARQPGGMPTPILIPAGSILEGRSANYKLRRELGRGAFGRVYEAEVMNRRDTQQIPPLVAVKVFILPPGWDMPQFLQREISSLLAVRTDRIPRVIDWRIDITEPFMVIPYYSRGSLSAAMDPNAPIPERDGWRLLTDLLAALRAAHTASLLHLDIKPANVLLDDHGGFVLVDFSIAQGSHAPPELVSAGLGSPGYSAPEQEDGRINELDARTDLWSAAATVWSALSGLRLYAHRAIRQVDPRGAALPPLRQYRPDCSAEMEAVLDHMLQVDRRNRPGSASEILGEIETLGHGLEMPGYALATVGIAMGSDPRETEVVLATLIDPLWHSIFQAAPEFRRNVAYFPGGKTLCRQGDRTFYTYILLRGSVSIQRTGREIAVEEREGTFLGEVSTLSGQPRTANLIAMGEVWAVILNGAELEELVSRYPAVAIRLLKTMATRLANMSNEFEG